MVRTGPKTVPSSNCVRGAFDCFHSCAMASLIARERPVVYQSTKTSSLDGDMSRLGQQNVRVNGSCRARRALELWVQAAQRSMSTLDPRAAICLKFTGMLKDAR